MTEFGVASDYPKVKVGDIPPREYGKFEILNALHELKVEPEDYLVIGGANLVIRGILTRTLDIDMLVSDRGFGVLAQELGATLEKPPLRARLEGATNRSVHLRAGFSEVPVTGAASMGKDYYPISFASQKPHEEYVENIPSMDLEELIASKRALARPKDITHLKRISEFLGRSIDLPEWPNIAVFDS